MIVRLLLFTTLLSTFARGATAPYIWWEGEAAGETNFPNRDTFAAATFPETRNLLSDGDWLTASGKQGKQALFARYDLNIPNPGTYDLWVRKFWSHGPFLWRFGDATWRECREDAPLADDTPLRKFVNVNWVYLGEIHLNGGATRFEVRLLASEGKEFSAGLDCFVLSSAAFVPNGPLKPGERSGKADEGFFPFEPPADPFTADALLDLRALNEKEAGQSGFIRRDGARFLMPDGKPVRFWAVNVDWHTARQDRASVDYLARKLAKLGVNMVRFHSSLLSKDNPSTIHPTKLEELQYFVAAMKKRGIYTELSFYFPIWLNQETVALGGYEGQKNRSPFAVLFFEPWMQALHRAWAKQILKANDPFNGSTLAKEPALALVEIVNEDSFFFWTFDKTKIPPRYWQDLENLWSNWLIKRYGSVEKAYEAWGGGRERDDRNDHAAILEAWHMTGKAVEKAGDARRRRISDQVRFLAGTQRSFYEDAKRSLNEDCGYRGMVVASNWTVTDPRLLSALERYTYTTGDVIDRHGYFSGPHEGEGAGWSVRVGHTFESRAAVRAPQDLPLRVEQVSGFPQIISELGFTQPNAYRADGVFLSAAYGALQGVDGMFFFAVGNNYVRDAAMYKFAVTSPAISGAFPAAALTYRRGDVREAEPAVRQVLKLDDLFALKGSAASSSTALDELRQRDVPAGVSVEGQVSKIDPLANYVGPVVETMGDDPAKSSQQDLSRYIDREKKSVRSLTGELHWDYGDGVARMNTPRSQGAAGFLAKAGRVELDDVVIESSNAFATVTVVSLDGEPLKRSNKLLIQVMTQEQPFGFRTEQDRITNLGSAPFGVRKIATKLTLKWRGVTGLKVSALDENGYATAKKVEVKHQEASGFELILDPTSIYHVVSRQ